MMVANFCATQHASLESIMKIVSLVDQKTQPHKPSDILCSSKADFC